MPQHEMDWDGLRILLEVARAGSFLRASETLGVATSTISRRISALEQNMGAALLERASDGCRLTTRGSLVADLAKSIARDLGRLQQHMDHALRGTITVACSDGFVPIVTQFAAHFEGLHPDCVVEVHVSNDFARLARGEADVAIRMVHLGEPSLIYRRIQTLPYGYFCAPPLATQIMGASPQDVPFVSVVPPLDRSAQARAATAAGFVRVRFRTNSFAALLDATRAGIGVAALPRTAAGDLVEVFAPLPLPDADVFLVTRATATHEPHVRAFLEALAAHMPAI